MIGIYQIRNNLNGMRYIGQSIDIERRWNEERNQKQVNPHLRHAFEKYGVENFTFSVLCECLPEELNELEQLIICETESHVKTKGYNKTFGGEGGYWTDERKQAHSIRVSGERNSFYGRSHTDEMKRKMSEARTGEKNWNFGKHWPVETRQKMAASKMGGKNHKARRTVQKTIDGVFVAVYPSAADAARALGKGKSAIMNCLNGRTATSCGFRWEYEN